MRLSVHLAQPCRLGLWFVMFVFWARHCWKNRPLMRTRRKRCLRRNLRPQCATRQPLSGKPYTFNGEGPTNPPQAFPPDSPILAAIPLPTILIQPEVEKLLQNWQQKQLSGENVETRYNWSLAVAAEFSGSMFQRKLGIPGFYHCGAASRSGGCRASCCEERPERSGSSHSGVVMWRFCGT